MSTNSKIAWTTTTWNFATGCTLRSAGCANCYAKALAEGFLKGVNPKYKNGFQFTVHPDAMDEPKRYRKSKLIFVNSMSDTFHELMPEETIRMAFDTMNEANQHTYQLLTKRADRLTELGPDLPWSEHIWCGVSVEHPRYRDRIDQLRACGAKVKFLSIEPLLGPIPDMDLAEIDWLIVGGESGKGARQCDVEWIRDIVGQCRAANVPVFVKQLGTVWAAEQGQKGKSRNKGGQIETWPLDLRIQEYPNGFVR